MMLSHAMVVLYGFGRIGRLLARLLIERNGRNNKLRLRAIVVRGGGEGDASQGSPSPPPAHDNRT